MTREPSRWQADATNNPEHIPKSSSAAMADRPLNLEHNSYVQTRTDGSRLDLLHIRKFHLVDPSHEAVVLRALFASDGQRHMRACTRHERSDPFGALYSMAKASRRKNIVRFMCVSPISQITPVT
jgi:hypothetical protein